MNSNLGDRMKKYENVNNQYLIPNIPVIIRVDGICFHSFTRGFSRPFDPILISAMQQTAKYLCENIQGCKLAYTQSDEITLLLTDYDRIETQGWFNYEVKKMISASASKTTMSFNKFFREIVMSDLIDSSIDKEKIKKYLNKVGIAEFDSRVFNLPKEEVCNNFIWRQQDAIRNAILMVGYANFSHKSLNNVNCKQIQEKLFQEKSINFNDFPVYQRRGTCIIKKQCNINGTIRNKWIIDNEIPTFTKNRNYIDDNVFLNKN